MADAPYIPAKTAQELANPAPKGQRHDQAMRIAIPLIGNGMDPSAVYAQLRATYPADVTDQELTNVVNFAVEKNPSPSGYGTNGHRNGHQPTPLARPAANGHVAKPDAPSRTPAEHCKWWMGDVTMTPEAVIAASPVPFKSPTGNRREELISWAEMLYRPEETINIIIEYVVRDGEEKASPKGAGKSITRLALCDFVRSKGIPGAEAGAWVRMNPCGPGSGAGGAITDADTTSFRFVLVESDSTPIETQLALYSRLKLPIAAMILSASKSAHAWVAVNSPDREHYDATAKRLLAALKPFGIDQGNKNPSRLSRLPSGRRKIGATGDGIQHLLWLNPCDIMLSEEKLVELEKLVAVPIFVEHPMKTLMRSSVDRFQELYENRGKLGVQIGLGQFDTDTGGLKAGQMTVIAAGTNQGKSTVAINFLKGALMNGHGVALFTLEMDKDEIMDLMIANICEVNRNSFNTGFFQNGDFDKITSQTKRIGDLPLWIFDDASITVDGIRERVMELKNAGKIGMVVIDYVQIVTHPDGRTPREQQVAEIARGLRILCKESKLPFIALSQLNDDGKLRESRVVAHEAHNVIILEPNEDQTRIMMKVVKGRRIMKKDYELFYQPEFARVHSSKIDPADYPDTRNPY